MKPTNCARPVAERRARCAGFTLAEVLAALVFMAIVIPVSVEGVRIANRAGVVAERKGTASRLGENLLNELIATGRWQDSSQSGSFEDAPPNFRWRLRNEAWNIDALRLITVEVIFNVQGKEYNVQLSTVVDPLQQQETLQAQQQEQSQP